MTSNTKEQILKELKEARKKAEEDIESSKTRTNLLYQKLRDTRKRIDTKLTDERKRIDMLYKDDTSEAYQHLSDIIDKIEWIESVKVEVIEKKSRTKTRYCRSLNLPFTFWIAVGALIGVLWITFGRSFFGT